MSAEQENSVPQVDTTQVKIKFFTRETDESLKVNEQPLYVPVDLKRYGLSEIVNHLLSRFGSETVPFDFLIDGELLRISLKDYLLQKGLSSEILLNLEYKRAVLPPSYLTSFNNDDWISSLHNVDDLIISGSYDGIVRTWNLSGQVRKQYAGHSAPIKCVKYINDTRIVSGSNDRTLRLWKTKREEQDDVEDDDIEEGKTLAILEGHKAPVVSVDVHQASNRMVSASYDNTIGLWSTNYKEMTTIDPLHADDSSLNKGQSTQQQKRRKLALKDGSVRRRAPLSILESHTAPVEQIIFDKSDESIAYSVSQDHTIKTWDLVTGRCFDTKTTSYSLLSVLQLPQLNLLACGSSARHITLHDPRSTTKVTNEQLIGHKNFVSSLSACPTNQYMFCSGSHDGTVKIWDTRSTKPLYTITRELSQQDNKVFATEWSSKIGGIISAGQDKQIQINKTDSIVA
ncbi:ribosome biogenesis protein ytm1 [Hanseniaspora vineae]